MILSFLMAPTATIDSGQISLTSMIQGVLLNMLEKAPATAVKNCGDVAIIMSLL